MVCISLMRPQGEEVHQASRIYPNDKTTVRSIKTQPAGCLCLFSTKLVTKIVDRHVCLLVAGDKSFAVSLVLFFRERFVLRLNLLKSFGLLYRPVRSRYVHFGRFVCVS